MRIKDLTSVPMDAPRINTVEERRGSDDFGHSFQRHMSDVQSQEYEEYIKGLTEKIFEQGKLMGDKIDIAAFQKYRELIIQLFNEAASNSYMFCKMDKFDSRGRHKVFAVIRKVNSRLDELAAMVLEQEADNIQLLDIVDDIRGMLVDMFL